jgi:predicted Zn-dependent peptidase
MSSHTHQITRLDNGLTVATASMPHMASVSVGVLVGTGGRYEPATMSGVSHFIEHLLFKGTKKRSAKRISEDIEGIGGDVNAWTGEENTLYYTKATAGHFTDVLDVLMDMFLNSQFSPQEIEKERDVIKEELAMYRDQPQQLVEDELNELMWPNHPLGRSVTGTEKTLDAMKRKELTSYFQSHYVTGNTIIAAAGCLTHQELLKAVSPYARHFGKGIRLSFEPAPEDQTQPRIKTIKRDIEQVQAVLGIRACSRHDPRRFALRVLNTLLGENMSSRLFQVLREDHGLAYSIGSSSTLFEDAGNVTVSAGIETEKVEVAIKLIMKEMRRFTTTLATQSELKRARDYLVGQLELYLENTANQLAWTAEHILSYKRIFTASEINLCLREVRPSQIRDAARDFFRPERMSLALVGPIKGSKHWIEWLQ